MGLAAAGAVAVLALVAIGAGLFIESGIYNIGADDHHTKIVLALVAQLDAIAAMNTWSAVGLRGMATLPWSHFVRSPSDRNGRGERPHVPPHAAPQALPRQRRFGAAGSTSRSMSW
jgi:hypothetical protein